MCAGAADRVLETLLEFLRGKDNRRRRVAKDVIEVRILREQIDRRDNISAVHGAQEHRHCGDAVAQHERDDRAGR